MVQSRWRPPCRLPVCLPVFVRAFAVFVQIAGGFSGAAGVDQRVVPVQLEYGAVRIVGEKTPADQHSRAGVDGGDARSRYSTWMLPAADAARAACGTTVPSMESPMAAAVIHAVSFFFINIHLMCPLSASLCAEMAYRFYRSSALRTYHYYICLIAQCQCTI